MAWSTIRRATSDDTERLNAAARRFYDRHALGGPPILLDHQDPLSISLTLRADPHAGYEISAVIDQLRPLWRAVVRRALRDNRAEGIAYGMVGYNVD